MNSHSEQQISYISHHKHQTFINCAAIMPTNTINTAINISSTIQEATDILYLIPSTSTKSISISFNTKCGGASLHASSNTHRSQLNDLDADPK